MTTNVGDIYYEISADVAPLLQGQRQADKALDSMEQSFNKTTKAADTLDTGLSKLSSAIKGLIAASALREMAGLVQKYQEMAERVQMATSSQAEFEMVQQRLLTTANGTYRSLQEAQELYIRTADSLRSMKYTTNQAIDVQDSMSYAFVKNATSADRANNAIDAFSKSINTGKVAADQWETITTAIPSVINDIATASKMTGAQVRALGAAGQLTAKQLTEGLRQSLEANSAAAAGMSNNLVDASVRIKTAITAILVAFEGETGVIQGFTNGLIASADAMLKFSQNSDRMTGFIDASTTAALVLAGVLGSRYVGALTSSASAHAKTTIAKIADTRASAAAAVATEAEAAAQLRLALAAKDTAASELNLAQARMNTLKATSASTVAEVAHADAELASIKTSLQQIQAEKALEVQRAKAQITEQGRIATATRMAQLRQAEAALTQQVARAESVAQNARAAAIATAEAQVSAARISLAEATGITTAANGRFIASQEASAVASRAASVAANLAKGALSLIGGPVGAAMLAATAIFYFWQKAQQAKQEAIAFADGLDKLNSSMKAMSNTQLRGTIADANVSIRAQKESISDLQNDVNKLTGRYQKFTPAAQQYADSMGQGTEFSLRQSEVSDELARKTRDLQSAKDKLARTEDTAAEASRTLTNNMLASMGVHDNLIEKGTVLEQVQGAVAKAFGNTANEINRANQAGQNFNPKALEISPPTDAGDKIILNLKEQNDLLKIQDERQRAVTKAGMEAAKSTSNVNQIESAKRLAGENFDLQKAEEARKKAVSDAESESKRSASQSESVAKKLADLKQQSELAGTSTQELSREQAILRAEQSLGSAATQAQIKEARDYAAKTWDVTNAIKMRQQAEQASRFINQEVSASKVQRDPYTGESQDPYAQVNDEEQRKLDALKKYQDMGVLSTQQFEDGKTAIVKQASNERISITQQESQRQVEVINTLLGGIGQGFSGLAEIISNSAGDTSAAYKALFAISKGFAVAQAGLNLQLAISNAMASGPFPWNMAAMAQVAAAGGQLISSIGGVSYGGARYNGGPVSADSMYRVGEGGKPEIFKASNGSQYMIPGDNGNVISNKEMQGGGSGIGSVSVVNNFTINTTNGIDQATMNQIGKLAYNQSLKAISDQQRPNGLLSRSK